MSERKFLFMQGAHRSGTSALANLMHGLGVHLGFDLLAAQQGINDEGFWEHRFVIETNDSILRRLNSCWYDFRSLPERWWEFSIFDDIRESISGWLRREFPDQILAGVKDPRLCRVLPLWQQVVVASGWQPCSIVIYRSAINVSRSLSRRDGFPEELGKLIWLAYNLDAECYSREMKTAFIEYDYLVDNKKSMIRDIARYFSDLELQVPETGVETIIRDDLRHHCEVVAYGGENDELDFICRQVLKNFSEDRTDAARSRMDHLRQSFFVYLTRSPSLSDAFFNMVHRFVGVNQELSRIGGMHSHAQAVVRQRDEEIAFHREAMAYKDGRIRSLDEELTGLSVQHKALRDSLEVLKREKQALLDKTSSASSERPPAAAAPEGESDAKLLVDRQKRIDDLQSILARRTAELQALTSKVQDLEKNLGDKGRQLSACQSAVAGLELSLSRLSQAYDEQYALHDRVSNDLSVSLARNAVLSKEMESLSHCLIEYESRNRKLVDEMTDLKDGIRDMQSDARRTEKSLADMAGLIAEYRSQEAFFDMKFLALSENREAVDALVLENRRLVARWESCQAAGESRVSELEEKIRTLNIALQSLQNRYCHVMSNRWIRVLVAAGLVKVSHE